MASTFDSKAVALRMFDDAGIEATTFDVEVLASDLDAIVEEDYSDFEPWTALNLAAGTLRERIGGLAQLRGYVDVLEANPKYQSDN